MYGGALKTGRLMSERRSNLSPWGRPTSTAGGVRRHVPLSGVGDPGEPIDQARRVRICTHMFSPVTVKRSAPPFQSSQW